MTTAKTTLPDQSRVLAARVALTANGMKVRDWAVTNGEDPALVYKVLSGKRPCTAGAFLRIAIKLGIRDADQALAA